MKLSPNSKVKKFNYKQNNINIEDNYQQKVSPPSFNNSKFMLKNPTYKAPNIYSQAAHNINLPNITIKNISKLKK